MTPRGQLHFHGAAYRGYEELLEAARADEEPLELTRSHRELLRATRSYLGARLHIDDTEGLLGGRDYILTRLSRGAPIY